MNLTFRQIEYTDLEFINNVRNQYANEYLHDSRTFDITGTKNWFLTTKPDYWMLLNEDNVIGYFRLSNYSSINKNIYIGADIAPEYVGKGFAKPSYILFMDFLFRGLMIHLLHQQRQLNYLKQLYNIKLHHQQVLLPDILICLILVGKV